MWEQMRFFFLPPRADDWTAGQNLCVRTSTGDLCEARVLGLAAWSNRVGQTDPRSGARLFGPCAIELARQKLPYGASHTAPKPTCEPSVDVGERNSSRYVLCTGRGSAKSCQDRRGRQRTGCLAWRSPPAGQLRAPSDPL